MSSDRVEMILFLEMSIIWHSDDLTDASKTKTTIKFKQNASWKLS